MIPKHTCRRYAKQSKITSSVFVPLEKIRRIPVHRGELSLSRSGRS